MTQTSSRTKQTIKPSVFKDYGELKNTRQKKVMVTPAANLDETNEEYMITIASPGFKRENFQIHFNNEIITVEATKQALFENCVHDLCEYDYHRWKRAFLLPDDGIAILARARYKEGELIISIPRGLSEKTTSNAITTIYVY